MLSLSVVFAIGDDIVEKLIELSPEERQDFILGFLDDDYFGNHLVDIEEFNDDWRVIFEFFKEQNIDIIDHVQPLYHSKDCLYLLAQKEYVIKIADRLASWNPEKIKQKYKDLVNPDKMYESKLNFNELTYYINIMKNISKQAMRVNGTLLFSLDSYQECNL